MKILLVFGTRPEAIKMAPLINEMRENALSIKPVICITAQHRGMLDQVLRIFNISPDYDLNIMEENQDLFDVVAKILPGLKKIIKKENPDLIMVQGDTTSAFVAGLAGYYSKVPVAHVEAGLRTYNKQSPFPEEVNRHLLSVLADYHFAPTNWARNNLRRENVDPGDIWVTGNTIIDALNMIKNAQMSRAVKKRYSDMFKDKFGIDVSGAGKKRKLILVTGHRRENFGNKFRNICMAILEIAKRRQDALVVYPVHLNPNVQRPVRSLLSNKPNIHLIEPLDYDAFVFLMSVSYLLLTDSGGIQEEAPSFGKPVLLMRDTTERPEGINAGVTKLVGTAKDDIVNEVLKLLDNEKAYNRIARIKNPYGDGNASKKIIRILKKEFGCC